VGFAEQPRSGFVGIYEKFYKGLRSLLGEEHESAGLKILGSK